MYPKMSAKMLPTPQIHKIPRTSDAMDMPFVPRDGGAIMGWR
jgi:hypothetical protein